MGFIYLYLGFQHTKKTYTRQELINLKSIKKMIEAWMILGAKFRSWANFPWFFQKQDSLF
jgi:hypothetical protein